VGRSMPQGTAAAGAVEKQYRALESAPQVPRPQRCHCTLRCWCRVLHGALARSDGPGAASCGCAPPGCKCHVRQRKLHQSHVLAAGGCVPMWAACAARGSTAAGAPPGRELRCAGAQGGRGGVLLNPRLPVHCAACRVAAVRCCACKSEYCVQRLQLQRGAGRLCHRTPPLVLMVRAQGYYGWRMMSTSGSMHCDVDCLVVESLLGPGRRRCAALPGPQAHGCRPLPGGAAR
jgi:hypothetical protein